MGPITDTDTPESAQEGQLKIAQQLNARYEGAAEVTAVQPSLRDFLNAPAGKPSTEVLGYCRSSLWDSHDGERKERGKASGYSLSSLLVAPARDRRARRAAIPPREDRALLGGGDVCGDAVGTYLGPGILAPGA